MDRAELEGLVKRWALGDEAAHDQLAAMLGRLELRGNDGVDPDFQKAAELFFDSHRDLANEDDMQRVREVDAALARERPDLSYEERLAAAGQLVRLGGFQPSGQESSYHDAIASMREARRGTPLSSNLKETQ